MTTASIDPEKLRTALRRMSRGQLLIIAERALELVPRTKVQAIVGDFVRRDYLAKTKRGVPDPLAEVRKFHEACIRRDYYESFRVNSTNFMDKSKGTEAFIAEFDRLVSKCVRAAESKVGAPIREAFELLFELLRIIDQGDEIIFFADEGGSWQVAPDWDAAMPAYFQSLAATAEPVDFAREVHRVIKDFDKHNGPRHLASARRVANARQKAALRAVPTAGERG